MVVLELVLQKNNEESIFVTDSGMEEGQGAKYDQHGTPSRKLPSPPPPPSPPSILGKNVSSQVHKTIINGLEVGGASASAYSRVHADAGETAQRKLTHKRIDRIRKGSVTHRNVSKQQLKGIRGSQKRNAVPRVNEREVREWASGNGDSGAAYVPIGVWYGRPGK